VRVLSDRIKAAEEACSMHRAEFEHKLEEVSLERDKALRDLSRLKQSLLDMVSISSMNFLICILICYTLYCCGRDNHSMIPDNRYSSVLVVGEFPFVILVEF